MVYTKYKLKIPGGVRFGYFIKQCSRGLFVENVERMVLFYRDILGFETDWDGGPFASFKVNDGGLFMFDRKELAEAMNQAYDPPQGFHQTVEIALDVPKKTDIDREYARLMTLDVYAAQEPTDASIEPNSSILSNPHKTRIL